MANSPEPENINNENYKSNNKPIIDGGGKTAFGRNATATVMVDVSG